MEVRRDFLDEQMLDLIHLGYSKNLIELRGFGTLKKKVNKAKEVRNPKTNEKLLKKENFKLHFKTGKILHSKLNSN